MKRSLRRRILVAAAVIAATGAGLALCWFLYINRAGYGLPYEASFTPETDDRWTALGGTWEVRDGSMRSESNDRGAKLLTGSPNWSDYVVEGDIHLLGTGSVGVLGRVSDAEVGENSFKGYFAAVRVVDNSLILGAYDFAYHEAAKVRLPDPVRPFRWYHIALRVEGCRITASVSAEGMGEVKTPTLHDPYCFQTGSVGLRSNGTGGVWRNFVVRPAGSAPAVRVESLPSTAAEWSRFESLSAARARPAQHRESTQSPPPQPVRSLLYLDPFGSPRVSIRGSVIMTTPAIYVEDATWGIEVLPDSPTPLKVGDEVEAVGEVNLDGYSPVLRNATIRLVREATPIPPTVAAVHQLADGYFDSRFVQVEGSLRSVTDGANGALVMELEAGPQTFRAIVPPGRSRVYVEQLDLESRLRLRGVSVVDARFNTAADPFVVLLRSAEDLEVAAGPPWWRASNLIVASLIGLGLIVAFNHLYLLAKHWRLRAVTDERARLAHELHDTLAQSFAGLAFQLQAIRNSLPRDAQDLEGQVDLAMSMARTGHAEARRSIASLRPESLETIGLLPALRESAERMVKNGNVVVEAHSDDGGIAVPTRIKDAFYRIGLEAIANAIRHANPGTIRIGLRRTRTSICLSVEDDGDGFSVSSEHRGFGLLGMRRRAESVSATLKVRSEIGMGTRVEVRVPRGTSLLLGIWANPLEH